MRSAASFDLICAKISFRLINTTRKPYLCGKQRTRPAFGELKQRDKRKLITSVYSAIDLGQASSSFANSKLRVVVQDSRRRRREIPSFRRSSRKKEYRDRPTTQCRIIPAVIHPPCLPMVFIPSRRAPFLLLLPATTAGSEGAERSSAENNEPNNLSAVGRSWRECERGRDRTVIYHLECSARETRYRSVQIETAK